MAPHVEWRELVVPGAELGANLAHAVGLPTQVVFYTWAYNVFKQHISFQQ